MGNYPTHKSGSAAKAATIASRKAGAFKRGAVTVTRSGRAK